MDFVYSFGSSSKGNSTFIGNEKSGIIIDCGIGVRSFMSDLNVLDIPFGALKGIFITHEHTDHVKSLKSIQKKLNIPIFATKKTLNCMIQKDLVLNSLLNEVAPEKDFLIDGFKVNCFDTPHDSVHSVGYVINTDSNKKISICTDLGYACSTVLENLFNSDLCLIESNYDEDMLFNGDYPYMLKKRIASAYGHLSNSDCTKIIGMLLENGCNRFLLSHLSENNNTENIALKTCITGLDQALINEDYFLGALRPKNLEYKKYIC